MIKRVFISNYKCLINFELKPQTNQMLFLGLNGAGKSSILEALYIMKNVAWGKNLKDCISAESFGLLGRDEEHPVRMETDIQIENDIYSYSLALDYPEKFRQPRVQKESLYVNGEKVFDRDFANITLLKNGHESCFSLDWHLAALVCIQADENSPIEKLKELLKNMIIISPIIPEIDCQAKQGDGEFLEKDCSNFVSWISYLSECNTDFYSEIKKFYRDFFPDFATLVYEKISPAVKELIFQFGSMRDSASSIRFQSLSEGEKNVFIFAAVYAYSQMFPHCFCFWDEPNNYLSVNVVNQIFRKFTGSFENRENHQLFVISHDLAVMDGFLDEDVWVIRRKNHKEQTLPPKCLKEYRETGSLDGEETDRESVKLAAVLGDLYLE